MDQHPENLKEYNECDDLLFIKELVGSAMYFSNLAEYAVLLEEKLQERTCWDKVRVIEFDDAKDSFVARNIPMSGNTSDVDFYPFSSSVISHTMQNTGVFTHKIDQNPSEGYEKKLQADGIKEICLSPIMRKNNFAGIVAGYAKSPDNLSQKDKKIIELAAEVIAFTHEWFSSNISLNKLVGELHNYKDRLVRQESLKIMGELAAGISHDLNNLLAGILGYTQIIGSKSTDSEILKILEKIESSISEGKEAVRSLQEISAVDFNPEFITVGLDEVIKRAVHLTRSKWQDEAWARNVEYKLEIDLPESLCISGSLSLLVEAFVIIILRVLSTIPDGGKITIEGTKDSQSVTVSFSCARDMKIYGAMCAFDPFITVDRGHDVINMQVACEIIQRHKGSVEVKGKIGQSDCITLKLPLIIKEKIQKDNSIPSRESKVQAKILVVEDEEIIRQLIIDVLSMEGFSVIAADNGHKALELFNSENFDIIITDLGMPVMSGFDLSRRIREIDKDIPIILATGWEAHLDKKKADEYSISYIAGKPFNFKKLIDNILASVSKYRSKREKINSN